MKKLFVLVFAIALCLGVLCVGASAAEEHDNHSDWTKLTQTNFNTNADLELKSGNYYLGEDVNCTGISQIRINGSVTLCLNGHVLDLDTGIIVVSSMYSGLTFTLCDCSSGTTHGYIDSNGLWHNGDDVPEGATECDLTGGVVTGGSSSINGGGVYLYDSTFNMTGGNIAGNTTTFNGGGVYVYNGTFNMTGGTITGNNAGNRGGGVYASVYSYNLSGDQTTVSNGMEFKLSGNPTIKDNTVNKGEPNETTSNVDLNQYYNNQESATVFTIVGRLSGGSPIGVTMDNLGVFTSGWSSYMQGKDPTSYFFSDITGYHVDLDGVEAALVANTYTVVFDANGGTGTMPPQTFTYNTAQNLTANTFTRTGYTVIGWNTAADGTGTPYKEGEQVINLTTEPNGTVTLYAQWTANEYTVTFDPNGGEGIISSQSFTYDTAQKLTGNGFTRTGYTFDGWKDDYGNSYFDEEIVENLTSELNGNVTLYAQCKANSYSVSLNLNGGRFADGAQDVTSYTYGAVTLLPDVTRSGYRFEGWYADEEFQDGPYTEISAADLGNKTFYARWSFINIPDPNGITVTQPANGTIRVNPSNGSAGTLITVTATPDKGYELDTIAVKDANGNTVKLTDKGNGKYTFTMPGSKVTVSAEFVEEQAASIFADVPADAYYAKAVEWAVKKGITNGKTDALFGANNPCTRGQIVTFLWRAAGSPAPKGTAKVPGDVLPGSYCYNAVAWAIENGITNGFADGTFGVNNTCTRGQSVTLLYRALGKAPTTVNGFTDVAADAFCADAVAWAVESGVTNGTSANTFSPNNGCTRAQIVTFLYRAKN